jgi:Fe-S-cluster containining protein
MEKPFYSNGLSFSCTRCSACCRYEGGYVFLSQKDVDNLATECQMPYNEFVTVYCRWIPAAGGKESLSLKEKANFDCIFWKEGCTVYTARPRQCRAFPFWQSVLSSSNAWKTAASGCPGMNRGALHSAAEIEAILDGEETIVQREKGAP